MYRGRPQPPKHLESCPKCRETLYVEVIPSEFYLRCKTCSEIKQPLKCNGKQCDFYVECAQCYLKSLKSSRTEYSKKQIEEKEIGESNCNNYKLLCVILIVLCGLLYLYSLSHSKVNQNMNADDLIRNLKKIYPSQTRETWYHFFSVLEKEKPSVKTITILYSKEKRTSECLTNELVSIFSDNKNIKKEEITFSNIGFEGTDYGLALEHYRETVKKFRVFIADLSEVSGNLARIFHSLCDEVSSDIKPSLFIFTLKYDKEIENLKPLEKATTLLKKTWSDLPDSELFPLLSRVVKNVVQVVPETQLRC